MVTAAYAAEAEPRCKRESRILCPAHARDETIEISKCAFNPMDTVLRRSYLLSRRLVSLIRSGEMDLVCAVTKEEVFMGPRCLLFQYPDDRCAELTFAFVNPEFRGQERWGIFFGCAFRRQEPATPWKDFMHTQWRTTPCYGKNLTSGMGSTIAASSWHQSRELEIQGHSQRSGTAPSAWFLASDIQDFPKNSRLYPPAHHREMVGKLY